MLQYVHQSHSITLTNMLREQERREGELDLEVEAEKDFNKGERLSTWRVLRLKCISCGLDRNP